MAKTTNPVSLAFVGFGNVGRALLQLLIDKQEELAQDHGFEWVAVGIHTARHGSALDPAGLDPAAALATVSGGKSLHSLSGRPGPADALDFIRACPADILFENTPVSYADGQPAIVHLQAALEHGMHAITANKGPVVHAYRELLSLAQSRGRRFLFEATVMGGAPIFSVWQEALPAARLHSFRGILNSTTNLILSRMESGSTFDEAVAHAQKLGIAETDPRGDTEGWDAAIKVAALVTVLMGQSLQPGDIPRHGITHLTPALVDGAAKAGRRWKLVCEAERTAEGVRASVGPKAIDATDPLYSVMETSAAITFSTDVLGPITISEGDSPNVTGPRSTAYGLLADAIRAVRGTRSAT